MEIWLNYHPDQFTVWPALWVEWAECENPQCGAWHLAVQFSFLVWSVTVHFDV